MRVAIVHDWLVTYRGGEKVLETLAKIYPDAPIYTMFYDPKSLPPSLRNRQIIYPKFINKFGKVRKLLLPFFPAIIEGFSLFEYDLVISTSSCVAKGVIPGPHSKHLCYLHSPMRYIWDQREEYLGFLKKLAPLRFLADIIATRLRSWDVTSSSRVDRFIVNSSFVGKRVHRYYRRESQVIHPPIDINRFQLPASSPTKNYFLAFGAFVPYKNFELAIEASRSAGTELVVAGSGPLADKLKSMCDAKVTFINRPSDEKAEELLQGAKALLFPCVEDFGMTAIEAMACGTPVIAYKDGGALDFIQPGVTGEFFANLTADSLATCLSSFDPDKYAPKTLRNYAESFSEEQFLTKIRSEIDALLTEGPA